MLKTITLLFALAFAMPSYSNDARNFLLNGGEVSFDVKKNPMVLNAVFSSTRSNDFLQVEVIEEYAGFECDVKSVEKVDLMEDPQTGEFSHFFQVRVTWNPGADLSGCYIEATNKAAEYKAKAHLFMNY